jgi:hypothetical protein
MDTILIGIVAVNKKYISFAKNLIVKVNNSVKTNFLILTDEPCQFEEFINVTTLLYNKPLFSYHDKLLIFKEGFKLYDSVLLLDADTNVRDDFFSTINIKDIPIGIYPEIIWRHPCDCSMENFLCGNTPRVPYGLEYKQFCENHELKTNGVLIQESFLFIKKNESIDHFIHIWELLADFCNKKDMERHQGILGYGEGYSIGISALNSNLIISENENICKLIKCFKHYAWEKWD